MKTHLQRRERTPDRQQIVRFVGMSVVLPVDRAQDDGKIIRSAGEIKSTLPDQFHSVCLQRRGGQGIVFRRNAQRFSQHVFSHLLRQSGGRTIFRWWNCKQSSRHGRWQGVPYISRKRIQPKMQYGYSATTRGTRSIVARGIVASGAQWVRIDS